MGTVDLVLRQEGTFRRLYAIKQPHAGLGDDEGFRQMFLDEGRIAGMLRHPNVVSVLDVGEDERGPFLVMDYVDGVSLQRILHDRGPERPLPLVLALRVGAQIAAGLHAAHELTDESGAPIGLVHRDVSPQNILVGFDGIVRLTDFGVAKALGRMTRTSTGVVKGKLGYVSPEQLRYEALDRRSDLFALGVVLHEMLVGQRLYPAHDGEGPRRILTEPPPDVGLARDGLPAELVELTFELLAKDAEDRPKTAREVMERLDAIRDELVQLGEPDVEVAEFLASSFAEDRAENEETRRDALAKAERGELAVWGEVTPATPSRQNVPLLAAAVIGVVLVAFGAAVLGAAVLGSGVLGSGVGRSLDPVDDDEVTTAAAPRPEPVVVAPASPPPALAPDEPIAPVESEPAEPTAPESPRRGRSARGRHRAASASEPAASEATSPTPSSSAGRSAPSPWPFAGGQRR